MKPTEKQIELIEFCEAMLHCWKITNDINSPTHFVDIEDFANADLEYFPDFMRGDICDSLENLLNVIRKV